MKRSMNHICGVAHLCADYFPRNCPHCKPHNWSTSCDTWCNTSDTRLNLIDQKCVNEGTLQYHVILDLLKKNGGEP